MHVRCECQRRQDLAVSRKNTAVVELLDKRATAPSPPRTDATRSGHCGEGDGDHGVSGQPMADAALDSLAGVTKPCDMMPLLAMALVIVLVRAPAPESDELFPPEHISRFVLRGLRAASALL